MSDNTLRKILFAAGIYNILWGLWTIFFPQHIFQIANLETLNYPEIWQCVGMIVGVYGVGYLIASGNPYKHWPITLVGLLGKIFGPIGFLKSLIEERFPLEFGITILTNDLIWWLPFSLILYNAYKLHKNKTTKI